MTEERAILRGMSRWKSRVLIACCGFLTMGSQCGDNLLIEDAGIDANRFDGGFVDFPDNKEDYIPGIGAYVATLTVPTITMGTPECCFDFQGKSENDGIDNKFAEFATAFTLPNMQSILDDLLDGGGMAPKLVLLFDHRGLAFETTDQFTLAMLYGQLEGSTTVIDAQEGNGTFDIQARSFMPGTGTPLSYFDGAVYNKSVGSVFTGARNIEFPFPANGDTFSVPLKDARIEGTATATRDGVTYTRGEISGYIVQEDFFGALNDTIASECSCVTGTKPVFTETSELVWADTCGTLDLSGCDATDDAICFGIAGSPAQGGACALWKTVAGNLLDIDSDGDDEYDAMSFGLEFTASEAVLVDVL